MKNWNSLKPCFYNKNHTFSPVEKRNYIIECEKNTFDYIKFKLELKRREEKIIGFLEEHAHFY